MMKSIQKMELAWVDWPHVNASSSEKATVTVEQIILEDKNAFAITSQVTIHYFCELCKKWLLHEGLTAEEGAAART